MTASRRFIELNQPFRVTFGTLTGLDVIDVEVSDGDYTGRGQCCPMSIYKQTADSTLADIAAVTPAIEVGEIDRAALQTLMPPSSARNALDCALWDLEAKRRGVSAWEVAGLPPRETLESDVSLGIDTPRDMAARAADLREASCIKLKLGGEHDLDCVAAVRAELPDMPLFVDVNCGWNLAQLNEYAPRLQELGVFMIEQPLPPEQDAELDGYTGPVPLCADESCHDRGDLPRLAGRFAYVNIKLDKTGGLTEALALAEAADAAGFRCMVGCMLGSGIAMAPAYILGTRCEVVDLDVPLIARRQGDDYVHHDGARLHLFNSSVWG
nr:dipeptide epimerase [Parahaliea mediterranea]